MLILLTISLLFYYLSFPNYFCLWGYWPCAWFFAVPLLAVLERSSFRQRILYGGLYSILFYAVLVSWFRTYHFFGYTFFVICLSLQTFLFCVIYCPCQNKKGLWFFFYPSVLWVSTEYVRSVILFGFSWDLGHSQSFNGIVLQITRLLGSSGVSFLILLVNTCLYRIFIQKKRAKIYIGIVFLIVSGLVGYGHYALDDPQQDIRFNVGTIQPQISYKDKLSSDRIKGIFDQQFVLSQELVNTKTNLHLLIWPETAIPSDFRQNKDFLSRLENMARKRNLYILIGSALYENDKTYNGAVLINPEGKISHIYRKQYLVPFSEYLPQGGLWKKIKQQTNIQDYNFSPGKTMGFFSMDLPEFFPFGVLICSEDTIASMFRTYAKHGMSFCIVLLNDGWFKDEIALMMHAQNSIIHAVENQLPIVRVANTGWSCYIQPNGKIYNFFQNSTQERKEKSLFPVVNFDFNQRKTFLYALQPTTTRTVYNSGGFFFSRLCLGFVVIHFIITIKDLLLIKRKSIL